MTVQAAPRLVPPEWLIKRYRDAYRVAKVVVAIGAFAQLAGIIAGLLIAGAGFVLTDGAGPREFRRHDGSEVVLQLAAVVAGAIVWMVFHIIGIITRAQGQILRASLDSAVHSSPFLNGDEKAQSMRL